MSDGEGHGHGAISQRAVRITLRFGSNGGSPQHHTLRQGQEDCLRIGRDPASEVPVNLPGVSWAHAELRLGTGTPGAPSLCLRDLSSNGTGLKDGSGGIARVKRGVDVEVPLNSLVVLPLKIKAATSANALESRMCFAVELGEEAAPPDPVQEALLAQAQMAREVQAAALRELQQQAQQQQAGTREARRGGAPSHGHHGHGRDSACAFETVRCEKVLQAARGDDRAEMAETGGTAETGAPATGRVAERIAEGDERNRSGGRILSMMCHGQSSFTEVRAGETNTNFSAAPPGLAEPEANGAAAPAAPAPALPADLLKARLRAQRREGGDQGPTELREDLRSAEPAPAAPAAPAAQREDETVRVRALPASHSHSATRCFLDAGVSRREKFCRFRTSERVQRERLRKRPGSKSERKRESLLAARKEGEKDSSSVGPAWLEAAAKAAAALMAKEAPSGGPGGFGPAAVGAVLGPPFGPGRVAPRGGLPLGLRPRPEKEVEPPSFEIGSDVQVLSQARSKSPSRSQVASSSCSKCHITSALSLCALFAEGQWKIGTVLAETATGFLVLTDMEQLEVPAAEAGALRPSFAPEAIRPNLPLRPARSLQQTPQRRLGLARARRAFEPRPAGLAASGGSQRQSEDSCEKAV
ncbi:unnamed protein product [Symbiodinium sp. CCMP2592]|nr:unnamed protein product [Symbiodinium sp. CCMP2592]